MLLPGPAPWVLAFNYSVGCPWRMFILGEKAEADGRGPAETPSTQALRALTLAKSCVSCQGDHSAAFPGSEPLSSSKKAVWSQPRFQQRKGVTVLDSETWGEARCQMRLRKNIPSQATPSKPKHQYFDLSFSPSLHVVKAHLYFHSLKASSP